MKSLIVFSLCMTMLLFGCSKQVNTQAEIQALKNLLAEWDSASTVGDFETLASFYTKDAVRMQPNEHAWVGNDAIRAGFKNESEQFDFEGVNTIKDVRVIGDWAFLRGVYSVKITTKTGGEPIQETGKWMSFLQRQQDGSWKIVSDIWNTDTPQS
ncbi:hypothetical protein BVY01_01275, partial [bacterium I07]